MFWRIVANENTKIFRRKLFWVELFLLLIIVLGLLMALFITIENDRDGASLPNGERIMLIEIITWPNAFANLLGMIGWNGFGSIFLVILIGAMTAQEYTWRTFRVWLTQGMSRPQLLTAKFATLVLGVTIFVLVAFIVGIVATGYFSILINGVLSTGRLDLSHLAVGFALTIFTLLPYGALTYFLAIASRSTVVAISGGLLYALVLESLIIQGIEMLGKPLASLALYMPGSLAEKLMSLNNASVGVEGGSEMISVSTAQAALGIGIWILVFLGLSLLIFQRQDLTE